MHIPKSSLAPLNGRCMRAQIVVMPVVFLPSQPFGICMGCRRFFFIMPFIHWLLLPPGDLLILTFRRPSVDTASWLVVFLTVRK